MLSPPLLTVLGHQHPENTSHSKHIMKGVPKDYQLEACNTRILKNEPESSIYGPIFTQVWQILASAGIESRIDLKEALDTDMPDRPRFWSITMLQKEGAEDVRVKIRRTNYLL